MGTLALEREDFISSPRSQEGAVSWPTADLTEPRHGLGHMSSFSRARRDDSQSVRAECDCVGESETFPQTFLVRDQLLVQ